MFSFLLSLLLFAPSTFASQWELNDVTYLLPLPNRAILNVSIRASELVGASQIIPQEFFEKAGGKNLLIGDIIPRSANFDKYTDLFAVGIRIDPCFKDVFEGVCRKQIRIVWQPVDNWKINRPNAVDAAVHTFYDLNDVEFESLLDDLQELKEKYHAKTASLPLGVHPEFSSSKATAFQSEFKHVVIKYIDLSRLRRIAVMKIAAFSLGWDLVSHDYDGQDLKIVPIFNSSTGEQQLINSANVGVDLEKIDDTTRPKLLDYFGSHDIHDSNHRSCSMVGNLEPEKETGDQILKFLADSSIATADNEEAKQSARTYFERATRIENPSIHLPGTIDCLSCHAANMTKLITAKASGETSVSPTYRSSLNLKNSSKHYGDTHNLRMLGYLNADMQLGDRVIFESAAVADALSKTRNP